MDLFANQPLPPVRPWEYIRLRRLAAGLTIEAAAKPHWHRPEQRADVERNLAHFEAPGVILRREYLLDIFPRSFPFDKDVYRQLRDEPPEQHPTICRGCGGTSWQLPLNRDGSEASLQPNGICTACEEKAERSAMRRAA